MAMKRKFDDAGDATYKVRVLILTSPLANSLLSGCKTVKMRSFPPLRIRQRRCNV